ncbi:MAG: 2-oxoglutarate dehydrogenase E1 component [Gammaproteobacteria bacterium]|nr:2-oxoglutarate dehydrogenase E1 component [Gammaproteobacteria bacterium]
MSDSYEQQLKSSLFSGGNAAYLEELYEHFLADPSSLPDEWQDYFRGFEAAGHEGGGIPHGPIKQEFAARARQPRLAASGGVDESLIRKQASVMRLIEAYRGRGHRRAKTDPLDLTELPDVPDLTPAFHGLGDSDMDTEFATLADGGDATMKLRDLVSMLDETYTGSIGFEYMHVTNSEERGWLKQQIEGSRGKADLQKDEKINLLEQLTAAEGMEKYLHTRYVGQKRFSLEGGESLIPMLNDLIQQGGKQGVEEIVVGMAHRGRLNVLINVLGKSPSELFSEFEGKHDNHEDRSGDVKYHQGFSSDIKTEGGNVHLALAFNPSHLEIVNPVVEGSVRARQDRRCDKHGEKVMPILVHGDAAFAGQGVVMETLQLSQARGFATGGTVHIVCNNQVGFTISDPRDARSTPYCTDIAKMLEAPILHVNGDDPEAVIHATRIALNYRQRFHKDVVIDLVCYRRHGHNEADEPSATQPVMYKTIRAKKTTRGIYADQLEGEGVVDGDAIKKMLDDYRGGLEEGQTRAKSHLGMIGNEYTVDWSKYFRQSLEDEVDTTIKKSDVKKLGDRIIDVPDDVELHSRVEKIVEGRRKMLAGEIDMDWGFAETMAYASLLTSGSPVRLVGQDSGRGTFFHRHAVWHNQKDAGTYVPLRHLSDDQRSFTVVDSLLSEEAVLGFEYGYCTADPTTLVIWEAQFGDFANGAQVVVDQFLSSGEAKWGRLCGLVMFLPHGYEGQGPEHSSARLERYLQLCAQHNMQVCVPTTPAQMFHMLRRQMVRELRKPLIVMTPKSLLRHKQSVSPLSDLTGGKFHLIIPEIDDIKPKSVKTVVFCSGKVYYDLLEERRNEELDDVALVRIEQLYPFPEKEYAEELAKYSNATDIVWCQEEPMNQGAWYQIRHRLQGGLGKKHELRYAGREHAASTAAGYYQMHVAEQKALIDDALNGGRNTANSNKSKKTGTE